MNGLAHTNDFQPYPGLGYGAAFTSGVESRGFSFETNTHTLALLRRNHNKYTFQVEINDCIAFESIED